MRAARPPSAELNHHPGSCVRIILYNLLYRTERIEREMLLLRRPREARWWWCSGGGASPCSTHDAALRYIIARV